MNGLIPYICSACGTHYEDTPASRPPLSPHTKEACRRALRTMRARAEDLAEEAELRKRAFEEHWGQPF